MAGRQDKDWLHGAVRERKRESVNLVCWWAVILVLWKCKAAGSHKGQPDRKSVQQQPIMMGAGCQLGDSSPATRFLERQVKICKVLFRLFFQWHTGLGSYPFYILVNYLFKYDGQGQLKVAHWAVFYIALKQYSYTLNLFCHIITTNLDVLWDFCTRPTQSSA